MKLHLGCGKRHLPGQDWLNIDNRADVGADMVMDVTHLDDISAGTVELIYACHVLEHVPRNQTLDVLREWRRVLKPGGLLRLAVPDFRAIARLYRDDKVPLWRLIGPLVGRQDYPENTHYNIFDYDYLAWHLEQAGFHSVTTWTLADWGLDAPCWGWDDYSQATIDARGISLNVEAIRGA